MLVKAGDTNVTTYFAMRLTADGKAATGLTPADFDLQYVRSGLVPVAKVDMVALAATNTAHTDNRGIEIDAIDQPGIYRIDWPDAAFSTGVREVILTAKVATAFTEHLRVELNAPVDVVAVSGDVTAADNLELMYDGTGYVDETAPASRAQVDGIGAASGGALNFANEADNVDSAIKSITFEGVETSGTNASVNSEDGTRHVIDDSSNNIDIVYQFDVGGGRTAVEVAWKGFLNGSNDEATLQAYNGTSFDTLFTISGKNGSTNDTHVIPLLGTHTGTGSDLGKVFIRIECAAQSNPTLNTDLLLVSAVSIGQTVGYQLGAVWIDTDDGVSGTESFVNGVADNPCLTLANAITIGSNVGLHRFVLTPESSITFGETHTNELWTGLGWTLALGNQDIGGSHFNGADVTGIGTGTAEVHFDHCEMGTCTLAEAHVDFCDIAGTITLSVAATYTFVDCSHAGSGATIDFGSAVGNTTVHLHNYHGAITIKNMGQTGTDVLHFSSSNGKLTLDSTCVGGTVNMNGTFDFVNNGSGLTINDAGAVIEVIGTPVGADISADIAALNDISVADILAGGDIDGFTLEETHKLLLAALSKISGADTATNTFRAADDSKDRITATVDADGNRTAVVFDAAG